MDLPSVVWFTPSFPMPLTGVKSTRMQIQKSIDAAISPWPSTRHSKLKLSVVLINFAKVTAPMQNHWLKSRTWYLWAIGPMPSAYFVISSRCTINSKSLKSYKSPKATSVPSNPTFTNYSPLHEKNYKNNQTSNISVCDYIQNTTTRHEKLLLVLVPCLLAIEIVLTQLKWNWTQIYTLYVLTRLQTVHVVW